MSDTPRLRLVSDADASLPEDVQLYRRWTEHRDQAAVSEIWRRYQRIGVHVVSRVLYRRADPIEQAREVCDEAFVQALQTFDPDRSSRTSTAPFRDWFLLIARRKALDRVRRKQLDTDSDAIPVQDTPRHIEKMEQRRHMRAVEAFVRAHYLEDDWYAIQAFLEGHSWSDIAAQFPIRIPHTVRFAIGVDEPDGDEVLATVAHILDVCPRVTVIIRGYQSPVGTDSKPSDLALQRAERVRLALIERIRTSPSRLSVEGAVDSDGPRVSFQVVGGAVRTAAAQRMRVRSILNRYRAGLNDEGGH